MFTKESKVNGFRYEVKNNCINEIDEATWCDLTSMYGFEKDMPLYNVYVINNNKIVAKAIIGRNYNNAGVFARIYDFNKNDVKSKREFYTGLTDCLNKSANEYANGYNQSYGREIKNSKPKISVGLQHKGFYNQLKNSLGSCKA